MKMTLRFAFLVLLSIAARGQGGDSFHEPFVGDAGDWVLRGTGSIDRSDRGVPSSLWAGSICVEGNGEDSGAWYRTGLQLEPKQLYRLSFSLRGEGSGGCAIAGPTTNNRDFQPGSEWRRRSFVFRAPDDTRGVELRLGQWHFRGKVWFGDVSLKRVMAVDRHAGSLRLGLGERIENGVYTFESIFEEEGSNDSRRLHEVRCGFNSHRLTFSPGSSITYRFPFLFFPLRSGRVGVNVGYHVGGKCLVEVSADGTRWESLGALDEVGSGFFDVPETFFPGGELFVRLRAEDTTSPASFQIYSLSFEAALEGAPDDVVGETRYLQVHSLPASFEVQILSLGALRPGRRDEIRLTIDRKQAGLELVGHLIEHHDNRGARLQRREGDSYVLTYGVTRAGPHRFEIAVWEAENEKERFEATLEFDVPALYATDFGRSIVRHDKCELWWCAGTRKVSRERLPPLEDGPDIEIEAARGEYESAQLVIRPRRELKDVMVTADELVGPGGARLPATAIELLRVGYLEVTHPTDEVGCRGWWPDPLPPLREPIDLAAGENQPIWIRVRVPEDAVPGDYRGWLYLSADGFSIALLLRLHVFDFTLPQETHLASAFGLDPWVIRRFHRLENDEQLRDVLDLYYENFAAHRISPYDPMVLDPPRVDFEGDGVTIDWSDFDRAAERYLDGLGFNSFRLRLLGMGSGTFHSRTPGAIGSYEIGTEGYERLFGEYVGQVEAHLAEKGWLEKAYLYWFDEPEPKDYDFVREGMEVVHRHAPGIRRMLTEQPDPELFGAVDLWCPVLHRYDLESCLARQHEDEEVWWYVCTGPKGDYTTLFIDHPAVNMRLWPWLSWKYRVDGLLVWTTTHWTSECAFPPPARQDPYIDPMAYVHGYSRPAGYVGYWGNGDGRFVYPPEACRSPEGGPVLEGPVDSIRWELLREGIEDYEYFLLLWRLMMQARYEWRLHDPAVQLAWPLLHIPPEICKSRTEFTRDPRGLYEYRHKVAKAIEGLSR